MNYAMAPDCTQAELDVIRSTYPTAGLAACSEKLPQRTEAAINLRAYLIGVKRAGITPRRPGSRGEKMRAEPIAPPPAPPKPTTQIVRAADMQPGMVANRYPVGTSAKPAFREITDARISGTGRHLFFGLAWRPVARARGEKLEMPVGWWDLDRFPDLAFEVQVQP